MAYEFKQIRTIEFVDTDMAGIVHFSNYFRFMESTEHAFFQSHGRRLHEHEGDGMTGFARVHAECDYRRPLRYLDRVEIHLLVARLGRSSLDYRFIFRRVGDQGEPCEPEEVAQGSLTVVCVRRSAPGDALQRAELPPELTAFLETAPAELLPEKP